MPAGAQSQSQKNTSSKPQSQSSNVKPKPKPAKPNGQSKPAVKPATATNRPQPVSKPSATQSSAAESDSSDSKELHAQIERLQREVKKLKSEKTKAPPARIIPRPSGEAGNRKTGFILIDTMGLSQNKDEYNRILLLVRDCYKEVKLERQTRYRHIDHTKLAAIIQLVCKRNEFMNSGAFPSDWPVAEIVKQYLSGQRKTNSRKRRGIYRKVMKSSSGSNSSATSSSSSPGPEPEDSHSVDGDADMHNADDVLVSGDEGDEADQPDVEQSDYEDSGEEGCPRKRTRKANH